MSTITPCTSYLISNGHHTFLLNSLSFSRGSLTQRGSDNMEDCVFDLGNATSGTLHVDEDVVVGIDECFLSTPNATPQVDPLIQLMETQPDEHFNDDGTLTLAAQNLLAGFSDCDVAMSMEPIDDVSSDDEQ